MKTYTLFIAAFCLLISNVFATSPQKNFFSFSTEKDYNSKIMLGAKFGLNLSDIYDSNDQNLQASIKPGIAVGAFLTVPIGTFLGVQPEILFSQKGYRATGSFLGSDYSFSRTANYLDIPLLVAIKPIKYLTILAGPQYSYLINQQYTFDNSLLNIVLEQSLENENIRKNTLCLTGGFDVNFQQLVISLRGGWDLFNNNGDGTTSTPRYKNVWSQLTFGYRF